MSEPTRCGHVALAGAPNVGKSSLLNRLVGSHLAIVSPKAQSTRLPVVGLLSEALTQFVFHDLPGLLDPAYPLQARMRVAMLATLERVHLVLHQERPGASEPYPGVRGDGRWLGSIGRNRDRHPGVARTDPGIPAGRAVRV
jgi:GTPase SAR1 family protein